MTHRDLIVTVPTEATLDHVADAAQRTFLLELLPQCRSFKEAAERAGLSEGTLRARLERLGVKISTKLTVEPSAANHVKHVA
ncbi:MAG: AsnC family protein [Pseudomonadota bacterium]